MTETLFPAAIWREWTRRARRKGRSRKRAPAFFLSCAAACSQRDRKARSNPQSKSNDCAPHQLSAKERKPAAAKQKCSPRARTTPQRTCVDVDTTSGRTTNPFEFWRETPLGPLDPSDRKSQEIPRNPNPGKSAFQVCFTRVNWEQKQNLCLIPRHRHWISLHYCHLKSSRTTLIIAPGRSKKLRSECYGWRRRSAR